MIQLTEAQAKKVQTLLGNYLEDLEAQEDGTRVEDKTYGPEVRSMMEVLEGSLLGL